MFNGSTAFAEPALVVLYTETPTRGLQIFLNRSAPFFKNLEEEEYEMEGNLIACPGMEMEVEMDQMDDYFGKWALLEDEMKGQVDLWWYHFAARSDSISCRRLVVKGADKAQEVVRDSQEYEMKDEEDKKKDDVEVKQERKLKPTTTYITP